MQVANLLAEHTLQLRLGTPTGTERLQREISRCAPTEHLDPTPFIEANVLLLVAGIGMNFTEQSIWDAYVERLDRASVAALAFAVGTAHDALPTGLVVACSRFDLPLLEVSPAVPLLKIDQHVESVLQAEHFELLDRGWALADECARLANQGAEISTLLASIYTALQAPVAVYDAFDSLIAKYPESTSWRTGTGRGSPSDTLLIPLPMGLSNPCQLAVRLVGTVTDPESVLAPAASILALQLNRSVVVDASRHQEMRRFVALCVAWSEATRGDVAKAFQDLGLNRSAETVLLVADLSGEHSAAAWQLRLAIHDAFHDVRIAEIDHQMLALAQAPRDDFSAIADRFLRFQPQIPLVLRSPTRTIDQLRLSLVHALDRVRHIDAPQLAPALGLNAIVAATAGRGAREAAEDFVAPLLAHDEQRSTQLLPTLRAWIKHNAQPTRACAELFIHRNSLSYRLRRIEELLNVSLDTVEGQATCLLALRLVDLEPY